MRPTISVLMSVYNENERFLREAIESILDQTFSDFEFIIVDDCSDEVTTAILKEYENKDNRIRVLRNGVNLGLTKSLNRALKESVGKYIARMDSDDISTRDRFKLQVNFLERNIKVDLLGGISLISNDLAYHHGYLKCDMNRLKIRLLFHNVVFSHPSAMIRKSFLDKTGVSYDERLKKSQDYGLWVECILKGANFYSLDDILLLKREHTNMISIAQRESQRADAIKVRKKMWGRFGIVLDDNELQIITSFSELQFSKEVNDVITKILQQTKKKSVLTRRYLNQEILLYYFMCYRKDRNNAIPAGIKIKFFALHNFLYLMKETRIKSVRINRITKNYRMKIIE